jgi:LCP family protein required for cell wall assembly
MRRSEHADEPEQGEPDQPDTGTSAGTTSGTTTSAGPTADASARAARRRHILSVAAGTLAVVVTLTLVSGSLFVYAKYREVFHSIQRQDVSRDIVHLKHAPPPDPKAENILLIGSDSRGGKNGVIGGRDGIDGQRSDTVMVLHLSPGAHSAVVLSFPRDSVVPVYSCTAEGGAPGQTAAPGEIEQINASFAYGGPGCLWKTVEETTHIHINDFIELTFTGFEKVVDDLGGVNVCLPERVDDPLSNLDLSAGVHHVYGWEALAFWRTREDVGSGMDTERIQRDQFLMASLVQGVERSGLLTSPTKIASVVGDLARSMTTDTAMTQSRLLSIANTLRGMSASSVQFIEVPWQLYPENTNWVQWQQPQAGALFSSIAHDTQWPATTGSSATPAASGQGSGTGTGSQLSTAGQAERLRNARASGSAGATTTPSPTPSATPNSLAKKYGGIRGNIGICQDKNAFSAGDVGH